MFALMPYLWILFMLGLIVVVIVAAVLGRPKRRPVPPAATLDPLASEPEPSLDFEDELSQMN